jgi:hypothetical protein
MTGSRRGGFRSHIGAAALCAATLIAGCDSLTKSGDSSVPAATISPPVLPGKAGAHRISQFVFCSDAPIKANTPLFAELSQLRDQIFLELQLPPSDTVVQVYLFDNQDRYERYMRYRYPELPKRRAFFVAHPGTAGGPRELLVFTFWGDHVRQDLRHELTHALLNSVLKEVPLWLDEGLAEYYELPPERDGVNALHMDAFRRGEVVANLDALERLDQVPQMGRPQYQEAWAWVHLMMRDSPAGRQVLLAYLQQLRGPSPAEPLSPNLRSVYPDLSMALARHLAAMNSPAASLRAVVGGRTIP